MKVILTSLNSKYIHTNLALRSLKANTIGEGISTDMVEYSVNDSLDDILGDLYSYEADVYGFSCYIWNIGETLKIVNNLKQVFPSCIVVLGGPEVSYNGRDILNNSQADFVVKGEGEFVFKQLLLTLKYDKLYGKVDGIFFKKDGLVCKNPPSKPIEDLDTLAFAYKDEDMAKYKNQILYYEGSRGCPYRCSYCLSSVDKTVRFLPLWRVKSDLLYFLDHRVKQVKFVDRSFNCNPKWAKDIILFILEKDNGLTNFHFEIVGDILDDETIQLLNTARKGLFQLEIGVQSVNSSTLKAINRNTDVNAIHDNVLKLRKSENMHLHLDLIAGLPFEDIESFETSFNRVYRMKPNVLQLGFLKLLKGSPMEAQKDKYNYKFSPYPPYEVLSNDFISYKELLFLKKVDKLMDKYFNSGIFNNSLQYLSELIYKEPFDFYKDFVSYWVDNNLFKKAHSRDNLYHILYLFMINLNVKESMALDLIKYDYLTYSKLTLPPFFPRKGPSKEEVFVLLKDNVFKENYLYQYKGESPKKIYKEIHIELFDHDITDITDIKLKATHILFHKGRAIVLN